MLIGSGGGLCSKNGLNGIGGYTGSGAVGLFSSISDVFSDLFLPSLLSRRQLASRLVVWSLSLFIVVSWFGNNLDWGIMFSPVSNRSMCGSGPYVFLVADFLLEFFVGSSDEL